MFETTNQYIITNVGESIPSGGVGIGRVEQKNSTKYELKHT
jgi:hypothetical protein